MSTSYTGKAGQLFAMSEFLMLGYNVAIPEVDRGDDIFVVRDSDGNLSRIQVKTAKARDNKKGFTIQFSLPREQLQSSPIPEITYILLIRHENKWTHQFAIRRRDLADKLVERLEKDSKDKKITLTLSVIDKKANCGRIDFTEYQQLSDLFPEINH